MIVTTHLGTVLFGSFLIAVIWTIITMVTIYQEAIKTAMSHEKLVPLRDFLIACVLCILNCLAECVEFGNKIAYIQVSIYQPLCYCTALCGGLLELLANMGKSAMVLIVSTFFSYLGTLIIMASGGVTT